MVLELSREEARRVAIRAQLLTDRRPADLFEVVDQLTLLQISYADYVAPNADLVLWSRLGSGFFRPELETALEAGELVEYRLMIRPAEDIALFRPEMADWQTGFELEPWEQSARNWVDANATFREDILDHIQAEGPTSQRDFTDTCVKPWKSSGWNNNRNVPLMLETLERMGEVAVSGRQKRERVWDLASNVYPDRPIPSREDAWRMRYERWFRSFGIVRSGGVGATTKPQDQYDLGEVAAVDGVSGSWRVDPSYLSSEFDGRAALLSPLDRLVYDRERMVDLFEFDYQLEMYKPAAKRKWGYFALPILYGDEFIGKLDAKADRKAGVFRVDAIHQDTDFTKAIESEVIAEIEDLAAWLELDLELSR